MLHSGMFLFSACIAEETGARPDTDTETGQRDPEASPLPDLDWSACTLVAPRPITDAEDLWKTVDPFVANIAILTLLDTNFESYAPYLCSEETVGTATTWYAPCSIGVDEFDFSQGSYRVDGDTVTYTDFVHDDFNGHWELDGAWTVTTGLATWALRMDISEWLQGLIEVAGEYQEDGDLMRAGGYARTTGAFIEPDFTMPDGDYCMDLHLEGRAGWLAAHSANEVVAVYEEDGCGRLYEDGVDIGATCLPW